MQLIDVMPTILELAGVPVPTLLAGAKALGQGNDILATGTKLYSQGNEELIIRDFFQDPSRRSE